MSSATMLTDSANKVASGQFASYESFQRGGGGLGRGGGLRIEAPGGGGSRAGPDAPSKQVDPLLQARSSNSIGQANSCPPAPSWVCSLFRERSAQAPVSDHR